MITIGRRQFLHNAGRLMLLPVFQGLLNDPAYAASKTGTWVHLYFPMGCVGTDWKIASMNNIPDFLSPFKSIQNNLLWMSDVSNPVNGAGGHEQAGGGAITCVTNEKDGKYDLSYATSADQIIAKAAKANFPNGTMALSRVGFQQGSDCCHAFESGLNYVSWIDQGKNTPTISDPTIAIKQFFSSGKKVDNLANTLADGKSSLDYFTSQVTAAKSKIGKDDALRLDQYAQAVRDYETRVSSLLSNQAQCGATPDIKNSAVFATHQSTMLDVIALALQCGVAPSITFMMDFEFSFQNYDFVGVNTGFHNVTHHDANATDLHKQHRAINTHYASQFSKLIQKVAKLTDANGNSVLNDVIISMGSGMSESNLHDRSGAIPFVIAGGSNLGVPQNKTYTPKVTMAELMRTIMSYSGLPDSAFKGYAGGDSTIAAKLKAL